MGLTVLLDSTFAARTAVYRLFDVSDRLLYVGVAINPDVRFAAHAQEKCWWPEVSRRTIEWHRDRVTALAAETAAIRTESPKYNVTCSDNPPRRRTERPKTTYDDLRPVRISADLWTKYEEIVGNNGRSTDLRAYIEWRVDHPTTPLPGRRRGPIKRNRPTPDA